MEKTVQSELREKQMQELAEFIADISHEFIENIDSPRMRVVEKLIGFSDDSDWEKLEVLLVQLIGDDTKCNEEKRNAK